jgi:hypothetical protein
MVFLIELLLTGSRMMDQLASIGIAFEDEFIDKIFEENVQYYEDAPKTPKTFSSMFSRRPDTQWAVTSVYDKHKPVRPFALGAISQSDKGIFLITGEATRTPGLYKRLNPDTGAPTKVAMTNTNERIHSSVRMRLELEGLGPGDHGLYNCKALTKKGPWLLSQREIEVADPIAWDASWGPETPPAAVAPENLRWVWEYDGPEKEAPIVHTMVEDNLGPYQRSVSHINYLIFYVRLFPILAGEGRR